jgi:hypothetical protein
MAIVSHQRQRPGAGWLRRHYELARRRLHRLSAAARVATPADLRTDYRRRLGEVWSVLGGARTVVENGWLQNHWKTGPEPRACLVAAVVEAVRQWDPSAGVPEAGPAVDFLWDALQESRGFGGGGAGGRSAPLDLRLVRIRDLIRWNDQPGRTRDEVLALLDLAQSRVVFAATSAEPVVEALVGRHK